MASLSTLPPEIFDKIVEQLYKLENFARPGLASLSMAEKKFYLPAKRRLLSKLDLGVRKAERLAYYLKSRPDLGSMIKELRLDCLEFYYDDSESMDDEPEYIDSLSPDDFKQLIDLLPELQELALDNCNVLLRKQSVDFVLPIFPKLTSLSLNLGGKPLDVDAVFQFVNSTSTPQLNTLDLQLTASAIAASSTMYTTSTFPIRQLSIWGTADVDLLRLPLESFVGLKHLDLQCGSSIPSIFEVIKLTGATIQILKLRGSKATPYSYVDIVKLFPFLTNLKELSIRRIRKLPVEFFQECPSTITTLVLPTLKSNHFEHLQSHPRPSLQIKHITFIKGIKASIFKCLPHSVVSVDLEDTRGFDSKATSIGNVIFCNKDRGLLNTIRFMTDDDHPYFENMSKLEHKFKALGIELQDVHRGSHAEEDW